MGGKAVRLTFVATSSAIINGVQNGVIYEVNGCIEAMCNKYPELIVLLTGGDRHFFVTANIREEI